MIKTILKNKLNLLKKLKVTFYDFKDEKKILIYQMGKVGSTSLENSLPESLHFHTLYGNSPCRPHLKQRRRGIIRTFEGFVSDFTKRIAIRLRKEVKIVSIVREPFSRDISMFFQDLPYWMCEHIGKINLDTRAEGFDILIDSFNDSYDWKYALTWFDKEVKRLTKIDVYKHEFDKKTGISLIRKGKYQLLLVKMESLNNNTEVLSSFTKAKLQLTDTNRAQNKWYAPIYRSFKSTFIPSKHYKDTVINSKLYRHFYK